MNFLKRKVVYDIDERERRLAFNIPPVNYNNRIISKIDNTFIVNNYSDAPSSTAATSIS